MGNACTREHERFLASVGKLSAAEPIFTAMLDVKFGGVLSSLPALLANGLLKYSDKFLDLSAGYYGLESILMVLAFSSLLRVETIEQIRYQDCGEMGKLIGLDRIPEVKTLRSKIKEISDSGDAAGWSRQLSMMWLEDNPELSGYLYIDGHVRVYYGKQTKLPKRYVAREKLCLRGVTDYWINDALGQPFFVVPQTINVGMLSVIREDIVPRLLSDIPGQPCDEELKEDVYMHRFALVFDREGYSPKFFKEMWQDRISCYTYRKYEKKDWPEEQFIETEVIHANGEKAFMRLSERGVYYENEKLWVREIRKLSDSGHQTALVTTDYRSETPQIASHMFSRWSQENFFKYMMQHYGIDSLIDYRFENISESIEVVNPRYRELDSKIRSLNGRLSRKKVEYADLVLEKNIEERRVKDFVRDKASLKEEIDEMEASISSFKKKRKEVGKHIPFSELAEAEKFRKQKSETKQFVDTIKMIAYRAETAMVSILREFMLKKDEARSLVRQILSAEADIMPDEASGILKVTIHSMTNPLHNRYVERLCSILNEAEVVFPGTNLRLVYNSVSKQIHGDQVF
jgi:hypothetical protein